MNNSKSITTKSLVISAVCLITGMAFAEVAGATQDVTFCTARPAMPASNAGRHSLFDELLHAYVADGVVAYNCFKRHEEKLDRYLSTLAKTDPQALPPTEALAFWINAYNAFTIKLILGRYPGIKSIKDIPRRWKRRDWVVGDRQYSLDDIEHKILRKEFQEPRIHFAIVCAAISCPDLASEAYVASRLDEQLTRAARSFLANPLKGLRTERVNKGSRGHRYEIFLSSIFKWFRKDFESDGRSVIDYVARYVDPMARDLLKEHRDELTVRHLRYDWNLNDR